MADLNNHWSLSNPGPDKLLVWLEPWAEEFEVPVRSTVTLTASTGSADGPLGEVDWKPDHLVVWASASGTIKVFVDGVLQRSSSAVISIPDGLTKQMLNIIFGDQPAARLGGQEFNATEPLSWWQRARYRLGV